MAAWAAVVPRLLFGVMFTMTGTLWFRRADPAGYLSDALAAVPRLEAATGLYDEFLVNIVLAHPLAFAMVTGTGELLVGLSLLLGYPRRAGAVGGVFLMMNYGWAFGNSLWPPSGNFLLALLLLPLVTRWPYARFAWRGRWHRKRGQAPSSR